MREVQRETNKGPDWHQGRQHSFDLLKAFIYQRPADAHDNNIQKLTKI